MTEPRSDPIGPLLKRGLEELQMDPRPDLLAAAEQFLRELWERNREVNLVKAASLKEVAVRHFLDSLTCAHLIAQGAHVVDVGSGGGFPGVPLALARRDIRVDLLESTKKKCRFLQEAAEKFLGNRGRVICERAEVLGQDAEARESYDVAVSRALGPMAVVCELCLPLVKVGGLMIAFKSSDVGAEVSQAEEALRLLGGGQVRIEWLRTPIEQTERSLVIVTKSEPTPTDYPRRPGIPKKRPLGIKQ